MKSHEEILEPYLGECQDQSVVGKQSALVAMQTAVDQYKTALIAEFENHKESAASPRDKVYLDAVCAVIETFDPANLKLPNTNQN